MKKFLLFFFAFCSVEAQTEDSYYYTEGTPPDSSSTTTFTVGPDGSTDTSYTGANGLLSALYAAVEAGASASNPIDIYVSPGSYTMSNFSIFDGINLIGTDSTSPSVIYVDYTSVNSATCSVQNISFQPQTLPNSAFNVLSADVSFTNCILGNLNASMGTCSIVCDSCTIAIPASTSGAASFIFTNCTLYNFLTSSAPVTVTAHSTSLAEDFTVNCGSPLDITLSGCSIGNGTYTNTSSMTLTITPTTTLGTVTKISGTDAVVIITDSP
jgi:hypothetical protein